MHLLMCDQHSDVPVLLQHPHIVLQLSSPTNLQGEYGTY